MTAAQPDEKGRDRERDVDAVIAMVRGALPTVRCEQLQVKFPGDDDGLWFFTLPGACGEAQIESTSGCCPFLIEGDTSDTRVECDSIESTSERVIDLLTGGRELP